MRADGFPIEYSLVRYPFFGVNSTVSGVGYNVAKALTTLGNRVDLMSLIGTDAAGKIIAEQLAFDGIPSHYVIQEAEQTAHSVIIFDGGSSAKRQNGVY